MKKIILFILFFCLLVSCGNMSDSGSSEISLKMNAPLFTEAEYTDDYLISLSVDNTTVDTKIISKTSYFDFVIPELKAGDHFFKVEVVGITNSEFQRTGIATATIFSNKLNLVNIDFYKPDIQHTSENTSLENNVFKISAIVSDDVRVKNVKLYYKTDINSTFNSKFMNRIGLTSNWSLDLPISSIQENSKLYYFIEADDGNESHFNYKIENYETVDNKNYAIQNPIIFDLYNSNDSDTVSDTTSENILAIKHLNVSDSIVANDYMLRFKIEINDLENITSKKMYYKFSNSDVYQEVNSYSTSGNAVYFEVTKMYETVEINYYFEVATSSSTYYYCNHGNTDNAYICRYNPLKYFYTFNSEYY